MFEYGGILKFLSIMMLHPIGIITVAILSIIFGAGIGYVLRVINK
jgi:hypothetical protein